MLRARIQEDFGQGHGALEAQSAIYHLYLRPDIGLSLDEFVALYDFPLLLRLGLAAPLVDGGDPQVYLRLGLPF